MTKWPAALKILMAYFIFSFWGPFVNKSSFTAFQNIFLISLFASVALIIILWKNKSLEELKRLKLTPIVAGFFISSGLGGVIWLKSLTLIPVAQALFLFASVPIFALLIEIIWLKQEIMPSNILAFLVGLTGIFIILSQDLASSSINFISIGSVLVLFSALMIGVQSIFIRSLGDVFRYEIIFLILLISQVVLSSIFAFREPWVFTTQSLLITLTMAFLAFVIAAKFYVESFKLFKASTVRLIGYTEILLGILWGIIFLKQPIVITTIVGGSLILVATYFAVQTRNIKE